MIIFLEEFIFRTSKIYHAKRLRITIKKKIKFLFPKKDSFNTFSGYKSTIGKITNQLNFYSFLLKNYRKISI